MNNMNMNDRNKHKQNKIKDVQMQFERNFSNDIDEFLKGKNIYYVIIIFLPFNFFKFFVCFISL